MKICSRKSLMFLAIAAMTFAGCEPSDADKDYGFTKIYIPQATVTGMDNSYPVPNGPLDQNKSYVCNFKDGKLNIALGAVRSGAVADEKAFSVSLKVCDSETARKIAEYESKDTPVAELPESVCTVPDRISVNKGENTGTCYLTVDLQSLSEQAASLLEGNTYRLLVLGLEITDPTEYELAETNTSVVIVLDLNSPEWDDAASKGLPEGGVRTLFPMTTI
ncbi:MAG: hypothetical protein IJ394_04415 [Bacteroidales bacterium]|nr:hypothetical protein [Bacteroidales bacterium]